MYELSVCDNMIELFLGSELSFFTLNYKSSDVFFLV